MIHTTRLVTSSAALMSRAPGDRDWFKTYQKRVVGEQLGRHIADRYSDEIKTWVDNDTTDLVHELSLFIYTRKELDELIKSVKDSK